ncbi:hypothetical protein [Desulfobulbus oligotrophicus]|jgi:hypothetical protein|uniref:Secreted protein n=1 Tax=Desulfobulbus oligotrophicus TaxID=1909699 RepID=A0A7T5VD96_9BACT|nr:hypothetical protein [Desulfobulbus oligotrophicus]MDY0390412.1 hypothetical protein [Desulfobulbus oligotrophicus]QQG65772.1 hypothetical protein HP555_07810 [Desulfobulbus oligotrophicus]
MKAMQRIQRLWLLPLVGILTVLPVQGAEQPPPEENVPQEKKIEQQPDKWSEAGREVRQATGSVADATKESAGTAWESLKTGSTTAWEKTRSGSVHLFESVGEKSREAWSVTKEETADFWNKGKSLIHEATAPDPPAPPVPPQEPVPPPPADVPSGDTGQSD